MHGKFVVGGNADIQEDTLWKRFLLPKVCTPRLIYFSEITRGLYQSAYVKMQSQFQAYLNGQRKFRWETKVSVEKLQTVIDSYKEGLIPKENIKWKQYATFPVDAKVEDVSKAQRALAHVQNTKGLLEGIHMKLNNRRKELFDSNMILLLWAEDEHKFVCSYIELLSELLIPLTAMIDDIGCVLCQLEKRFSFQSTIVAKSPWDT